MEVQRAFCIVRNEALHKQVFIVEPTTPVEDFRQMIAEKFQYELQEIDLYLQNSSCPLYHLSSTSESLSSSGLVFIKSNWNNLFFFTKKKDYPSKYITPPAEDIQIYMKQPPPEISFLKEGRRTHINTDPEFCGLRNVGNSCYFNSIVQYLYMTPEFHNAILKLKFSQNCEEEEEDLLNRKQTLDKLKKLFLCMKLSKSSTLCARELLYSHQWYKNTMRHVEQDVQEVLTAVLNEYDSSLTKLNIQNFVKDKFEGASTSYIQCDTCKTANKQKSAFRDIQLPIRDNNTKQCYGTLIDALRAYITPEEMVESNQYECSICKKKSDAKKILEFLKFPYFLNFNLMRFNYSVEDRAVVKLNNRVEFPSKLNMNEFITGEETKELYNYELYAIIIHSGTPSSGHYYAQIKNFTTRQWYSFNDEAVRSIQISMAIERAFGNGISACNAYMVCYRRVSKENEKSLKVTELPSTTKELARLYLAEKDERLYIFTIYINFLSNLMSSVFYISEAATLSDLINDVEQVFQPYLIDVDLSNCRLITYDPVKMKLLRTLFGNKTIKEYVTEYKTNNLIFKHCPHLSNIEKPTIIVFCDYPLWETPSKPMIREDDPLPMSRNGQILTNYYHDGKIFRCVKNSLVSTYFNILISGIVQNNLRFKFTIPERQMSDFNPAAVVTTLNSCFPDFDPKIIRRSDLLNLLKLYKFLLENKISWTKYRFHIKISSSRVLQLQVIH